MKKKILFKLFLSFFFIKKKKRKNFHKKKKKAAKKLIYFLFVKFFFSCFIFILLNPLFHLNFFPIFDLSFQLTIFFFFQSVFLFLLFSYSDMRKINIQLKNAMNNKREISIFLFSFFFFCC